MKTMFFLLGSELSFGTLFAMNFVTSPRELSLLEAEDDYVESPILLQKIGSYRANTEFNL